LANNSSGRPQHRRACPTKRGRSGSIGSWNDRAPGDPPHHEDPALIAHLDHAAGAAARQIPAEIEFDAGVLELAQVNAPRPFVLARARLAHPHRRDATDGFEQQSSSGKRSHQLRHDKIALGQIPQNPAAHEIEKARRGPFSRHCRRKART